MSQIQSFGASGATERFTRKRDTTLGYFSVMPPFEVGPDCHRFHSRTQVSGKTQFPPTIQPMSDTNSFRAVRLKSGLQKGGQETTLVSDHDKTSNVSAYDSIHVAI